MSREKILVPLGMNGQDLKAVYHALALAERVNARVFIVFLDAAGPDTGTRCRIETACREIIQSIPGNGPALTYHIITRNHEEELLRIIDHEHIDLIVISQTDVHLAQRIKRIIPQITCQVIQVKGKDNINLLQQKR